MQNVMKDFFNQERIVEEYKNHVSDIGLWNSEKRLINKYLQYKDNILDIGCGAGRVSFGLYDNGYNNVTGIDMCNEMVMVASNIAEQKKCNIKFKTCDASCMPFKDEEFDSAIFSFNGLVLIPKRENRYTVVKEINRVLKQNGVFIFTTDDRRIDKQYRYLWKKELSKWKDSIQDKRTIDFGDWVFDTKDGEIYFYFPNKEEVVEMLNKCGFKVLQDISIRRFKESELVKSICGDIRFWVAQKM